ncbi:MAG: TolC family protein [Nitrospira sp.]|nr:TolC family protein [Nitrospira sp.]
MTTWRIALGVCGLATGILVADSMSADVSSGEPIQSPPAPASHSLPLTLQAALSAALNNNPDVLLYKERIQEAQGHVRTQFGAMLPTLSANVRQTRQTQFLGTIGLSPVRTDPFSIFDTRISATQHLFSLSLIQRWRASRESLQVTEQESEARMLDTMASVGLAYMEGLKAMAMVKMHEANQLVMNELLGTIRQRQRGGVATRLDLARLEAQLAVERQQGSSARYELEHAKLTLINLLALPIESALALTDEWMTGVPTMPTPEGAVETALSQRPEVRAQAIRVKASELTYSSITGERVPSLVAQGEYGLIGNRWNNTLDTYNMALTLQIPIFDGAQREGRIAQARSQMQQEALRLKSVLNHVTMEVHDALASLASAHEQVSIAQAGLRMATTELDLARERYAVMTSASHFELTNGLSAVTRARENLVNALFQLNAARINFARSTGSVPTLNEDSQAERRASGYLDLK